MTNADDFQTLIGNRPYPAINWQTLWLGWVLVPRGATAMRFTFAYQSDVPGAVNLGTTAGFNEMRIRLGDESDSGFQPLGITHSAGRQTGFHSITVGLREQQAADTIMTCVIQVKANNDQPDVLTTHGNLGTGLTTLASHRLPYIHLETDPIKYWHPNQAAPGPEANSFEAMYYGELSGTMYENSPAANRLEHDIILTEDHLGDSITQACMVGILGEPNTGFQTGRTKISQCFFWRSMAYSPVFGVTSNEKMFEPDRLPPNVEFGGSEATTQSVWASELLRTWRVASYGPRGRKADSVGSNHDLSTIANYEYAVHWPIVKGDYKGSAGILLTTGTLTFTTGPDNINRTLGSYITDGVTIGSRIVIVGGTNPGVKTVTGGITASNVLVAETLIPAGPEAVTSVTLFVAGEESTVIDDAFYLTTEDPQLELRCLWLMVQHGASNLNIDLYDDRRRDKSGNRGNIDQKFSISNTSSSLGNCLWTFNARIQQMNDLVAGGATWDLDSTVYGSKTDETINLEVWPSNAQANTEDWPPVLRGTDFMEIGGKGTPAFGNFWYKEGSLFLDHGDNVAGMLQPTVHAIDITNTTTPVTNRPFRLKVTMDLDDFIDPLREDLLGDPLLETARLMLVGYQLLEMPRII